MNSFRCFKLKTRSFSSKMINNTLNPYSLDLLYERCIHRENNFEKIEFQLDCFVFKLTSDWKFSLLTLTFLVIIFIDIIANLFVIFSILIEKFKRRVDICFMSNALSDLTMGLVIMPFTAIYTLFGHFPLPEYVCFMWNCLDFICGTSSMLHVAFISYDRYLCVYKPLHYNSKQKNVHWLRKLSTYLIMGFIWFIATISWIPGFVLFLIILHG